MTSLSRCLRVCTMLASGAFLLQVAGCDVTQFLQILNTIFLGIMAGAGYVIIRNVS